MSGCQEGEPPSEELLKFYSKFCKFFFSAFFWLQIRVYVSHSQSEEDRAADTRKRVNTLSRIHEMVVIASSYKQRPELKRIGAKIID